LIVIAATNRPDHLDSAILRSWRLDKKIYIWPPDFIARKELFEIYLKKKQRPTTKLDFDKLAELTDWYVSAVNKIDSDLKINEVKKTIKNSVITMELIEQEIQETTPSLKFTDISLYENWQKKVSSDS